MAQTIRFTIPGVPIAKGRPRATVRRIGGKVVASAYTPAKTRSAEETFSARSFAYRPEKPLTGPLHLAVTFFFPVPQSWPKRRRSVIHGREEIGIYEPHVTKPDCDNLLKLVADALNGAFWLDDKQIASVLVEKLYSEFPRTDVVIRTIEAVA